MKKTKEIEYDSKRIYGTSRQNMYSKSVKKLEDSDVTEANKTLIKQFIEHLFTE